MGKGHAVPLIVAGLAALLAACSGTVSSPDAGSTGGSGSAGSGGVLQCQNPLATAPLALLTRSQYDNTVEDLLGDSSKPSQSFPPENQVQGFKNNTTLHRVSPLLVEKFLDSAEALSERAVTTRLDALAPCAAGAAPASCGTSFVRSFGLRAFRRPLSVTEEQLFDDLFRRTLQSQDYASAVKLVLQAFLQSPQFLYRVDSRLAPTETTGAIALGPYELASRLAYFLTGSMPDAELFSAAAQNQLRSDAEVELQARRLLTTTRAREVVREFHRQWLGLDNLPATRRDAPELGAEAELLGRDLLTSFDRFIDQVYWQQGQFSALFESKTVYLNSRLASAFGLPAASADFAPTEFADRNGLLTQPGLLSLLSHSNQTAPVQRGVFVLERLMCMTVPPPPPAVNTIPPDPNPNSTTRERFRVHTEKEECAACHRLIDGIGFGFEAYDQLGRYRSVENNRPIDVSGEVLVGDPALDGPYQGTAALALRLAQSSRVRDCVATSWYRFALGRLDTEADRCSLQDVQSQFAQTGRLADLLVGITRSVAFRYRPAAGGP